MVEFAFISPIVLVMIFGSIAGAFLYFQNEAMHNAARAASRYTTIEQGLSVSKSGALCESGTPDSILNQVKNTSNIAPVNPALLCEPVGATTHNRLVQTPYVANKINIVVDVYPDLTNPQCATVNLTYTPSKMPGFPLIVMQAASTAPFSNATGATTCPAPTKAS